MDLTELLNAVDAAVWGPPMIILLLGCHIYTTIRTKVIQRKLPLALKLSVTKDDGAEGDVSNFGAMATSLASTLGTGSIVGVATAVLSGGPGAVLWMWLTGILGMATKYTEVFAAMKYRVKDWRGEMMGGAMHVWEQRYKRPDGTVPWWAKLAAIWFALLACITIFGIGSAVQTSAITSVVRANFGWDPAIVSAFVCGTALLVILGGLQKVSGICGKLVPIMGGAYILGCIYILFCNSSFLVESFCLIFECAFTPKAAFGGAVGSGIMFALQFGCARGLFSNESGLGSAPIVAAAAATKNPARQALVAMTGTFWSTVVICAVTGIMLVAVGIANPGLIENGGIKEGAALASAAFATIPYIGTPILVLGMVSFAYSTILGWSYYGNRCVTYLFGAKAQLPYQVFYVIIGFLGAVGIGDAVWLVSDIGNALMAIPNIIMVLALSGLIARETQHYIYDGNLDEVCEDEIPMIESK